MLIPTEPLIVTGAFGPRLPAPRVADALARGFQAAGLQGTDLCPLPEDLEEVAGIRAWLEQHAIDSRLRRARGGILGEWLLEERILPGAATFGIAPPARHSRGAPPALAGGDPRDRSVA